MGVDVGCGCVYRGRGYSGPKRTMYQILMNTVSGPRQRIMCKADTKLHWDWPGLPELHAYTIVLAAAPSLTVALEK